ncbi:hypothetical protein GCM10009741_51860 [Kribbella lupini]|uniref:Uncharacterized protein n=1 Tax=Kribbella lupini TaxID=291602 RepID=A0ABP4MF35_9ACTN
MADTVPLRAFPILTSPCKYLRRAGFLEAKGTQTWRAYESKKTPRSSDWAKFAMFPDLARAATQGSQCTAVASAKRGVVLSVFVFRTTPEATRQLAPDQNWPRLGEQADLGSVDRGGSGFVRVGRVMIHVTILYDDLAGEAGRRAVHGVLTDLMPGLPTA